MKARQRKPRAGRPLTGLTAQDLVVHSEVAQAMHDDLTAKGFVLQRGCRPYLRRDMDVSMRFVWRHRAEGETVTLSIVCPAARRPNGTLIIGVGHGWQTGRQYKICKPLEMAP